MSLFLIVALPFLGALLPGLMNQAGRAACAGVTFTVTLAAFVGLMTNLPSVLAGEVVLNCMSADGTRSGYDIAQLTAARAVLPIPLVASGGAGAAQHFVDVFEAADVDAALAATVFHSGQIPIPELKRTLAAAGIEVRPC